MRTATNGLGVNRCWSTSDRGLPLDMGGCPVADACSGVTRQVTFTHQLSVPVFGPSRPLPEPAGWLSIRSQWETGTVASRSLCSLSITSNSSKQLRPKVPYSPSLVKDDRGGCCDRFRHSGASASEDWETHLPRDLDAGSGDAPLPAGSKRSPERNQPSTDGDC